MLLLWNSAKNLPKELIEYINKTVVFILKVSITQVVSVWRFQETDILDRQKIKVIQMFGKKKSQEREEEDN